MKKVYIETMGCQMNKSDAERMYGMLEHIGYTQTDEPKEADMLVINTCSIRKLSEDKAYSAIGVWGKWKKKKPDLKIVFSGCVAQQAGKNACCFEKYGYPGIFRFSRKSHQAEVAAGGVFYSPAL